MPRHHHLLRRHPAPDTTSPSDNATTHHHPPQPPPAPQRASRSRLGHHAQWQTPPSQGLSIPQLHPSSGPIDPDHPLHSHPGQHAHHPAATAALFSLFGRGVHGRPSNHPGDQMMDEDDEEDVLEDDYDEGPSEHVHEQDHDQLNRLRQRHHHRRLHARSVSSDELLSTQDIHDRDEPSEIEEVEQEPEHDHDEEEEIDEEEVEPEPGTDSEMLHDREKSPTPLPPNLREISSLASWTVSTHKPGCGVSALRHPSPSQYWQSDGPQPHTLTLHFFKLVAIVRIRVYLDFEMDESYTPTKMTFLAGMGGNDLVEFANWEGEGPCGWVDVELEGVGGRSGGWVRTGKSGGAATGGGRKAGAGVGGKMKPKGIMKRSHILEDHDGDSDDDEDDDEENDPYAGNVLKAMVIQMRVIENHQNGKDTHVRGFQVFARDDERKRVGNAPSASADGRVRRHSARRSLRGSTQEEMEGPEARAKVVTSLEEPDWMGEPVIR
ncbi:anaphase promoting complex subunit DOC1 [Aspergillus ibericus CBS 121593]|uniref:Galactose-binding like protein n=1 Tax=Aspergillus ibericus CBS 121593 TaxID=1448316 RepID=A0A395GJE1_9EURO|nr:galactose-binding like protein [Aspergillus ibericus CBS 121593]RAK95402.1 galactose-binding like protein [Aspergillus ibericus CBS 121593]